MITVGEVILKFNPLSQGKLSESDKLLICKNVLRSLYADLEGIEMPEINKESELPFGEETASLLSDALSCENAKANGDSTEYENYRISFNNRYLELLKNYRRTHEPKKARFSY